MLGKITKKENTNNELIRNLFSVNGVESIFLGKDFISINKLDEVDWDEIKHIVISLINDFYSSGKNYVIEKDINEIKLDLVHLHVNNFGKINSKQFPSVIELTFSKRIYNKKRPEGDYMFPVNNLDQPNNFSKEDLKNNKEFESGLFLVIYSFIVSAAIIPLFIAV